MTDVDELRRLMNNDEPLHPDLEEYVYETEMFGPVLKHPLVFDVPMSFTSLVNKRYEHKLKAVDDADREGNWSQYIWLHERPYRLEAFFDIEERLTDAEYWDLLGDVWIDSENIYENYADWSEALGSERANSHLMMSKEERAALEELPDRIRIWRGGIEDLNELGLSWTTDKSRAVWFADRFANVGVRGEAVVTEAYVHKSNVVAYFTRRGENEIVILEPECLEINS